MFKDYAKIMGYVVLTLITLAAVGGGLRFAGVFGERVVFEQSFQYKKGMESRALQLQTQIAEIDKQLVQAPEKHEELMAQRKVFELQLQATML
ncbi:hypothetical protein [Vibrio phage vB_VhaP_PG11]|nr:hypothetical protein [Vibrio phage vB_VhaP_PG11]